MRLRHAEQSPNTNTTTTNTIRKEPRLPRTSLRRTSGCSHTASNHSSSTCSTCSSSGASKADSFFPLKSCLKQSKSDNNSNMPPSSGSSTPDPSSRRRRAAPQPPDEALKDPPGSSSTPTRVQFSVVEIREFERVVGDNPSCSSGVPISIGWNHGRTYAMMLEDFESARPARRAQLDLVLTRGERHRLLVEWGASGQDVIEAIRMIIRVKNQRRQTVNNLGSYDRIEEVFERFMRGAKRVVFRSNANQTARRLKEASERAAEVATESKKHTLAVPLAMKKSSSNKNVSVAAAEQAAPETNPRRMSNIRDTDSYDNDDDNDGRPPPCSEVNVFENHQGESSCSQCSQCSQTTEKHATTTVTTSSNSKQPQHHHHHIEMETTVKVTARTTRGSQVVETTEKVESTQVSFDVDDFVQNEVDEEDENATTPSDISESAQSATATDEADSSFYSNKQRAQEQQQQQQEDVVPLLSRDEAAEALASTKRLSQQRYASESSSVSGVADDDVDNMSNPQSQEHAMRAGKSNSSATNIMHNEDSQKGKKIRMRRRKQQYLDNDDNATTISI